MKSEINDLKGRVSAQGGQAAKPDWGRSPYRGQRGGYQPRYPSRGCQSCKERGRGEECDHCFACGSSGHVARECTRNRNRGSRQGSGQRLFRRDTIVDSNSFKSHRCNGCGQVQLERTMFLRCSKCKTVNYCTRACQGKHWPDH